MARLQQTLLNVTEESGHDNGRVGIVGGSVAGTGDTMAGIVASLLGQGMERREAAELGAWLLGKTGELATAEYGPGVVATDVIERIPRTIR
ncbi:hypothetical protein CP557_04375 [Natrinema ejinorense]|uniref:YjeF C-terminal domain-containing protein n=1 Tax=Natrinema ejinorense TaxID=373386 RepID=A0A2A5QSM4_9EURY|nr:hypothetical protein CP557_04375 [Natrinema ejinorense]